MQDKNPVYEYWLAINNGVTVCKKIYAVYQKLVADMKDPKSPWIYNNRKADHAILFIETFCRQSKGQFGGLNVKLELWQKAMVAAMFGFVDKQTGLRRFREVVLMVARKNGKSTLGSAIGIYLMVADQEPGAEIYAVATKRDQAKIIWMEAVKMVRKSPELLRLIKPRVAEMRSEFNDSIFQPLGNDSDTLDGLNVHGALMDELHAWKDTNLYDVIVDGVSARRQPLILITTTAGTVRDGIFDIKYEEIERVIDSYTGECINDRILPLIYELDARSEWTQPDCWIKANPGLGTIKSAEVLADKVKAAQLDSLKVKNLVCKDFNVRETGATAYMTYEEILNTQVFDTNTMRPRYAIGGADLSETTDLTAAVVLFRMPGDWHLYIRAMFWMPEDLLEIRVKEDKVPYDIWKQQGLLRTTPGNKLHPKYVTQWFVEMSEEMDTYITWIGYDAWAAAYWVEDMQASFGPNAMEAVRQGKQTLSIPLKELKADLSAKRVIYQNHPILKWCLSNMNVESDKNGNIQPCKGKNPRARIDGAAALLNAYVIYKKHEEEYLSDVNVENEGA